MKNVAIATIVGFVASFVFGIAAFTLFYEQASADAAAAFPGCYHAEPNLILGFGAAFIQSLLYAICANKMGFHDLKSGAINGAWFGGMVWLIVNVNNLALFSAYETSMFYIDTLISILWSGFAGGAIGWALGKFKD